MDRSEVLFEASRFRVVRKTYRTADGREHSRETIEHPGAVVILPLLADDRLVLIRNYRPAVDKELLELPAGTLEPGEDPLTTAQRELEEETGYRAARWQPLYQFYMSPGILRERMHLYVASELEETRQDLDAGEQIEPLVMRWAEALQLVDSGAIEDAKTLASLLYYDRLRK